MYNTMNQNKNMLNTFLKINADYVYSDYILVVFESTGASRFEVNKNN